MQLLRKMLLTYGLIVVILVVPVNVSHFEQIFAQREHYQFGGQGGQFGGQGGQFGGQGGQDNTARSTGAGVQFGGQIGQGGQDNTARSTGVGGQDNTARSTGVGCQTEAKNAGGVGCQTEAKNAGGVGCQTEAKNIVGNECRVGSTDITNTQDSTNNVVVTNPASSSDSSSSDSSSLEGKTYIIHGQTTNSGGSPFSSTASCHSNDSILGGGYIYKIIEGNVISVSSIPDSVSSFTTTIESDSNSDSSTSVQSYAICYNNP